MTARETMGDGLTVTTAWRPATLAVFVYLMGLSATCCSGSQSRYDWAGQLVPADAAAISIRNWTVGTWSAEKTYTFESRREAQEYRAFVRGKLQGLWRCALSSPDCLSYRRLTAGEQQALDITLGVSRPQTLQVSVTFRATGT